MRNADLIIQNDGLFMSTKPQQNPKNISVKNQKERGKATVRKHVSLVCCILTLDMFCVILQILLTLVSHAKLF